jgi:hypothetical protein
MFSRDKVMFGLSWEIYACDEIYYPVVNFLFVFACLLNLLQNQIKTNIIF